MPHAESVVLQPAAGPPDARPSAVGPSVVVPLTGPLVVGSPTEAPVGASVAGGPVVGSPAGGSPAGASSGPTAEPPEGADPLLWRLAYGLHRDHRPDIDGSCVTCQVPFPCPARGLADRGFAAAMVPRDTPPR